MNNILRDWPKALFASLTIGLAPFVPEPHIIADLRWVLGGAHGMTAMNWFDLAMHGTPWLWLIYALAMLAKDKFSQKAV
jgi:hypothetical protein